MTKRRMCKKRSALLRGEKTALAYQLAETTRESNDALCMLRSDLESAAKREVSLKIEREGLLGELEGLRMKNVEELAMMAKARREWEEETRKKEEELTRLCGVLREESERCRRDGCLAYAEGVG